MRNLIGIFIIGLLAVSCSKESTPDPVVQTPNPTPTATTTCMQSTWKYEIILGTPVAAGMFKITYLDEFNNGITDTTITSTWSKSLVQQIESAPNGVVNRSITIQAGLSGITASQTNNLVNTVTVTIYRDGNVVSSTGIPLDFCLDSSGNYTCPGTSTSAITKNYVCTD